MELNQIQFHSPDPRSIEGYLGGRKVTKLGWDSSNTVETMETHPEFRRQGLMSQTWNAGVQQAGYLRHSPERTDLGQKFAAKQSKESGKKLPRRQGTPTYTSNEEWT